MKPTAIYQIKLQIFSLALLGLIIVHYGSLCGVSVTNVGYCYFIPSLFLRFSQHFISAELPPRFGHFWLVSILVAVLVVVNRYNLVLLADQLD